MAAMQRNNVATRYPREAKARLVRWREIEGLMPGEIAARAHTEWPDLPRIHAGTWQRWAASREYRELRDLVVPYEQDLSEDRVLAAALNDGRGPEALADLVVMDVVRELRRQTRDGGISDLRDLAAVTRSLSPILRRQVDEAKLAADRRIGEMRDEHAAALAARDATIAELRGEIERLRGALAAAGIDPDADSERKGEGLSPAALRQIEEKAKLL